MRTCWLGLFFSFIMATLASSLGATDLLDDEKKFLSRRTGFWAFKKPIATSVPATATATTLRPIDAFIQEALQKKRLTSSPRLAKRQLIRRLTLDLTGLPPTPQEIDAFLADHSPNAYENLVDRLMASPKYGERWALKWLDIVRYADTNGFELDEERTHAWRYRDYVIDAFKNNLPYDQFVQQQLAGDEIFPTSQQALIATGFLRAGPEHLVGGNQDEEMNRQEVLTEMATSVGSVFLGVTLQCARCHNHKFDPILQSDYYRVQAIFAATEGKELPLSDTAEQDKFKAARKQHKALVAAVESRIKQLEKPYREAINERKRLALEPKFAAVIDLPDDQCSAEQKLLKKAAKKLAEAEWDEVIKALSPGDAAQRKVLRKEIHQLEWNQPQPPIAAYAVANQTKAPDTFILKGGDHRHKVRTVDPGVLSILSGPPIAATPAGRRTQLARWLTSKDHPLTARVMVNRIWQFRMGSGLVKTPNDFGLLGSRPTNQPLLDWLAVEFMQSGWDIKKLDKSILMSDVYQQTTDIDPAKAAVDANNDFYWRANRRRLEGEAIRDSVLAVTNSLNSKMYGRPVRVPIEPEVYDLIFTEYETDNLWPLDPDPKEHRRRSIYLLNKRTVRLPMLANFDQPDSMTSCAARSTSVHALQALNLMNSDFMAEQSDLFAQRLTTLCKSDQNCQIKQAHLLAVGRTPDATELVWAKQFLKKGMLRDYCLAMLNRSEFVYAP
jgi:hypothetical protein